MKTDETISNDQQESTKASVGTDQATPIAAADEQAMAKPSVVWFLVPIVIIALAIFLAR